ncbi:glycosyltransferase family 2 protein [Olleya aquimaris]|uniref:Glycosyltransferase involved in cell wall biosynthesis n=1 Tax=Olleya aquimaris TaxID=639310 RepID=A0A327R8X6_9FLAO|nr:glycosyltransferase family 2 protein [Olleya aquimaris]RAJ13161.1 glycosyltransferase involved in cell wall biosynthesis [Olleya aquimaris]
MKTLTVIIPTYNEENYLENALRSVRFADQIIVVDSMSTDKTVEIAERYNCKVLSRKFDNFSNQKNHALQYATGEWILFIDADERVPNALKQEIIAAMNSNKHAGYKLNFPHFYMNRFLYNHSDNVTRLVKRDNCKFEGLVHEKLIVEGTIGQLKNPVLHFTYKGLLHYISKKDSYAWFQAEQLLKKGKKATYFHLAFKPFYRFFSSYILRRGFMDGIPGLAVASINAYGVFSRYVKLMLLQRGIR